MPEDWAETIPYCRQVCREFDVPFVVEQAIYQREMETFKDNRRERRPGLRLNHPPLEAQVPRGGRLVGW
jgi:hypothetical protein